ncbi:hypothetical protein LWI29_038560 [Acer saccharum]|uniref:Glutamyl/glutaminyl-tRNA synthetase class Ib catalytic domain-containing protein n=1 Tax=Acer saccharum TaxID=4024 RepID=A0AA39SZ64_ACESA|nr:hypothetical protein LWI29_038560 [Acer saccharum]
MKDEKENFGVLEVLAKDMDEFGWRKVAPVWQIFLSFLYREGYWALVSFSCGNGDSCIGILKPFTVFSALLCIVDDESFAHSVLHELGGVNLAPFVMKRDKEICKSDMIAAHDRDVKSEKNKSSLLSVIAAAKIAHIPLLSVIAAAKLADIPLSMDTAGAAPTFMFSNGLKWSEAYVLLRYIGRVGNLYGQNEYECGQIDEWLEYALAFLSGSEFETASNYVDMYLEKRTLLVGDCLSIADIAIWSALVGIRQTWESLRKYNLARWFNSICAEYSDSLNEITATYVGKRGLGKSSSRPCFEVDLPDAEIGKVRFRFAPEPSGYLHIGHSKAALLNQYFAQHYQGQLIVRFDDTNPAKESNEFVDNLLKDIETLGIKYEAVTYTSDYFPDLMEMAETLIRRGKAYVDDTPREQM